MEVAKDTISIIIVALNEENNLLPTYEKVKKAISGRFQDYEIIIFNDGSTDNTGKIADNIAESDKKTIVVHNKQPKNIGYAYKTGIKMAGMEYVILVTGDNDVSAETFEATFDLRHKADMIIPYHLNSYIRPVFRRFISKCFVILLNLLTGLKLKYYNGMVLHKTSVINSIEIKTDSFAYQAEALIKLIKKGHNYVELGIELVDRKKGFSKAFKLKNILGVLKAILDIIMEVI